MFTTTRSSRTQGSSTRSSSPTMLSGELIIRVNAQDELMDALEDLLVQATEPDNDITPSEVTVMSEQLDEMHQTFRKEHSWLVTHWPPAHLDHSYFARKVSSNESKLVFKIRRQLSRLRDKLTGSSCQPINSLESTQRVLSRLPELAVPTFTGDSRMWPDFKAMFISVIGNRTDLSDLEKFQYLKSALKSEALDLIINLTPRAEAYEAAWVLLNTRFENKRLIIKAHLDRLLSLKPMTKRRSASLTKMVNILNETTQVLKALTSENNNDCLMVTIASGLLDQDTRERWETSLTSSDEFPSLNQLTDFLMTRACTLENIEASSTASQQTILEGAVPKGVTAHQTLQLSWASSSKPANQATQSAQRKSSYPCDCCNQDHYIVMCPILRDLSVDQRMKIVKNSQLCYNCLGRHNVRKCNNRTRCRICNGAHHTMLHGSDFRNSHSSTVRAQSTQDVQAASTPEAKPPKRMKFRDDCE